MLKPMYTPGFAAPEHYNNPRDLLGPWSDIYSVGASMYACISGGGAAGGRPAPRKRDTLMPAMALGWASIRDQLLETIDWCMRLNHL
jgi:serine/threonine protein kinase